MQTLPQLLRRTRYSRILPVLCLMAFTMEAKIIVLHTAEQSVGREQMREAAKTLGQKTTESTLNALRSTGIHALVSEQNILGPELSPAAPASLVYVWSDGPVEMRPGFNTNGPTVFEKSGQTDPAEGPGLKKGSDLPEVHFTNLSGASLNEGLLRLSYSLEKAGKVTVQLLGIDGRLIGAWEWNESQRGRHQKQLELPLGSGTGPTFVRWSHGNVNLVKRLQMVKTHE